MLETILKRCSQHVKPNTGIVFVADFNYVNMSKDGWEKFWGGMCTSMIKGTPPKDFEPFGFFINTAPEHVFEIFQIPRHVMIQAGLAAGFNTAELKPTYPDPAVKDDPVVRRYLDECEASDYLLKFKIAKP